MAKVYITWPRTNRTVSTVLFCVSCHRKYYHYILQFDAKDHTSVASRSLPQLRIFRDFYVSDGIWNIWTGLVNFRMLDWKPAELKPSLPLLVSRQGRVIDGKHLWDVDNDGRFLITLALLEGCEEGTALFKSTSIGNGSAIIRITVHVVAKMDHLSKEKWTVMERVSSHRISAAVTEEVECRIVCRQHTWAFLSWQHPCSVGWGASDTPWLRGESFWG